MISPTVQCFPNEKKILNWVKQFRYPHCRKAKAISDLRSGIALAEILTEKIHNQYHYLFLSQIQIFDQSDSKCIQNLTKILQTLQILSNYIPCSLSPSKVHSKHKNQQNLKRKQTLQQQLKQQYSGIQLFSNLKTLQQFILNIMMTLDEWINDIKLNEPTTYTELIQSQDINNLSSIQLQNTLTMQRGNIKKQKNKRIYERNNEKEINNIRQEDNCECFCEQKMKVLTKWIKETFNMQFDQKTPQFIMGQIVNTILIGNRSDNKNKIIKSSHYEMGQLTVYRKITDFLLRSCEKINKLNLIRMSEDIQEGILSENVYWSVIQDLKEVKANTFHTHSKKYSNVSIKKTVVNQDDPRSDQENNLFLANILTIQTNKTNQNDKNGMHPHTNNMQPHTNNIQPHTNGMHPHTNGMHPHKLCNVKQYSEQIIQKMQAWIKEELGYEHSLNKSKIQSERRLNPILNGVLIGSIIMRLKIAKINIIREPINEKQINQNIDQIVKSLIRNGYQSGRYFCMYQPTYNLYLGILWELKTSLENKQKNTQQERSKRIECKRITKGIECKKITKTEKKELIQWLRQQKYIETLTNETDALTISKLIQICSLIFKINLHRETSQNLKHKNYEKVMLQLRNLGISSANNQNKIFMFYENHEEDKLEECLWDVMKDLQCYLQDKVQYF